MKILIIPDVHGRDFWRTAIRNELYDKLIFLGEYLDHYYSESTDEHDVETLEDIIELKKSDPDNIILLIGNHDCPYIWPKRYGNALGSYWCRHDYANHDRINKIFTNNIDLFTFAWDCHNVKYGKVLFTHAGVTNIFKKLCGLSARDINKYFFDNIHRLASVSSYRGGYDESGSIVWADVYEHVRSQVPQVFQIFGHTYSVRPLVYEHFAMLDDGGKHYYILDEDGLRSVDAYNGNVEEL